MARKSSFAAMAILVGGCVLVSNALAEQPKQRRVLLQYDVRVVGLPSGAAVRMWVPRPSASDVQTAELRSVVVRSAPGGKHRETVEPTYKNRMLFFEGSPVDGDPAAGIPVNNGVISLKSRYDISRKELLSGGLAAHQLEGGSRDRFLSANRLVPITGKPISLLAGVILPRATLPKARAMYDVVLQHLRYDKSRPGYGRGDSAWACDSRFGNCSDFHSLFISLARSQAIPARFEMGFPLPEKRGSGAVGGYHCWAWFHRLDGGWTPVDISEADKHPELSDFYFGNLSENRVAFTSGRDITLSPPQNGPPLNFFIFPHVEVDGAPWPSDRVQWKVRYRDLPADAKANAGRLSE